MSAWRSRKGRSDQPKSSIPLARRHVLNASSVRHSHGGTSSGAVNVATVAESSTSVSLAATK